ncbi:hypothetical protein JCM8547_005180 [Rhodosporidiobolus lusitaniae]
MSSPSASPYAYGLLPVPRSPSLLNPAHPSSPRALTRSELLALVPTTELCQKAEGYVKDKLGDAMWYHSRRAFLFGAAVALVQFPSWTSSSPGWEEALYLACLFHDLGATEKGVAATKTSFEFHSAVLARSFLLSHSPASTSGGEKEGKNSNHRDLVDSVSEAIWRHTDFVSSQITMAGQLLQLGTLYDNLHSNPSWVHPSTVRTIANMYAREGWAGCFEEAMKREVERKPWSHTTAFDYPLEDGGTVWEKLREDRLGKAVKGKL